jgi:hypothetical protein
LLFAGLVATWLAVLVPMAARRRQPMSRPSDAALSCRVLQRPRRRSQEVTTMDDATDARTPTGEAEPWDYQDRPDEQPASPRYRQGRGGFDPEAAALAARARYTFRQRMVLALVLVAVASALVAGGLRLTEGWLVHAAIDLCLIGYLGYLRRQVRMEQAIRTRRTARLAGSRASSTARASGAGRARRRNVGGRDMTVADAVAAREARRHHDAADRVPDQRTPHGDDEPAELGDDDELVDAEPAPSADDEPGLPRLRPSPPPERPSGTVVLELDDEDPELHDLDHERYRAYRRAAGQ